jgi:hypothetical protein
MSTFRLITYDVWGNEKDGYEVNQAFTTNECYEIPDSDESSEQIIATLKKQGCFKKYVRKSSIEIDGDTDVIYVSYKGRPEFELRKEDNP